MNSRLPELDLQPTAPPNSNDAATTATSHDAILFMAASVSAFRPFFPAATSTKGGG
jgi:hypothetical protein